MDQRARFLDLVQRNPINGAILDRGPALGVLDWWLTAGAVFQTVWNVLDGRSPGAGIADYDLFYYDASDLSYEAEDAVIRKATALFADLCVTVEVRNEARVHLWYESRFGVPGVRFTSSADAIDHFASTTCCFGVSRTPRGELVDYAPHGYADLFAMRVRPNPLLAPRAVYEAKAQRWQHEWPGLVVEPWPDSMEVAG
ncbi:nucleotidyltransferase family protein [Pseudonocardia alaniniphila]|uniref:Nucleotidyltransferase family protein n=1 Tax=Pseudonocardia alaniniphila TaxID=75291 RepID=A0ABS9THM6_9PSEU|nr:nucleotidyltransferase family protein [Pseudonocardia alaniniphila]MCH6168046.1 nucleotidyltransferase family protein [Pseudonocardia alaniniphila]